MGTTLPGSTIERVAESEMNILDRLLMRNALTQEQYDAEVKKLDQWCEKQYRAE